MAKPDITAARLLQFLHYDRTTGGLTWRHRPQSEFNDLRSFIAWNARYEGMPAGSNSVAGYIIVTINGTKKLAHRVIWAMNTGAWPAQHIDHINGIRSDNRMVNLRDVSPQTNMQNVRAVTRGQSNPMGVFFNKRKVLRPFSANIRVDGKTKHLGYFDSPEEASAAYLKAKREHHPGFAS